MWMRRSDKHVLLASKKFALIFGHYVQQRKQKQKEREAQKQNQRLITPKAIADQ
ncbi:MAG: hypothetical protein LBR25_05390 [Erysipelotrichaceae bacterium]|jgi:hypothetical protein|nr:hypothetical protein [Erysipelotrichaceae bacterium]